MQTLRDWLADDTLRLITLTGPGGAGKTRLALELARRLRQTASRVWYSSPLAAIRSAAFVAPAIAEAFGLSDVTALDLPKRAGSRATIGRRCCVLDNFEQSWTRPRSVADLLTAVTSLRVLVTSRAAASCARRAGVRRRTARAGSSDVDACRPPISRALPPCGCSWNGFGMCGQIFASRRKRPDRDGDLPAARCAAACPRTRGAVDQSPDRRGSAAATDATTSCSRPPARAICPKRQQTMNATVAWSYQLLARMNSACSAGSARCRVVFRSRQRRRSWPVGERVRLTAATRRSRGGRLDRQEPGAARRDRRWRLVLCTRCSKPSGRMRWCNSPPLDERDDALEGLARYCVGEAVLAAEGLVGTRAGRMAGSRA